MQDDFRTKSRSRRNFDQGGHQRHYDARLNASLRCMKRYRLSMVACAGSDHPARFLGFRQHKNLVESSALFECTCALQVVEFQEHLLTRHLRQGCGMWSRGTVNEIANPRSCCLYSL